MIRLGGGCKDITTRTIESLSGPMLIVHIHVDCRDAMGANAVNTIAELLAPELERITKGRSLLRILSNLATQRLACICDLYTRGDEQCRRCGRVRRSWNSRSTPLRNG